MSANLAFASEPTFVPFAETDLPLLGNVGSGEFRQFLQEHHHRVGQLCHTVAATHGLEPSHSEAVARAGALHDIGKIFVPEAILQQPGPLNDKERDLVQKHSYWGSIILGRNTDPIMQLAATVALQHHECWDGTGYPFGLSGEDICIEARIVTVCDVYDALRAQRPYKEGYSHQQAMDVMLHGDERLSPNMFDPDVLRAFIAAQLQCETIFNEGRHIN